MMEINRLICLSAVLLGVFPGFGQDSTGAETRSARPYFVQMNNQVKLKLAGTNDLETLYLDQPGNNDYDIRQNASTVLKLFFNYRYLSFNLKTVPRFFPGNDDKEEKGRSSGTGFGLNLNMKKWLQEISFSRSQGFYLANTSHFVPGWQEGDAFVQFPDLVYKSFSGYTAYKFNPNFSFNALTTQTERQLKSAGSFIPSLYYSYYITDNRRPLSGNQSSQKAQNLELIISAGYYHSFVLRRRFYISLGLNPGYGWVRSRIKTRYVDLHNTDTEVNDIFRLEGLLGLGYNGERFFAGVYGKFTDSYFELLQTSVINGKARVLGQVFFGIRLPAPNWLKEKMDKADQFIGK